MRDRNIDQQQAMEAAAAILPIIYRILDEAVSFYFSDKYSHAARADHDDRVMANCIYSHAEKGMIGEADRVTGLCSIKMRGLHVLNYKDRALIRFKKVRPNGKHSNYQTQQQEDYDNQKSFPELPKPAYRLTAGYHLDPSGTTLGRIMIARPLGRSIFWSAQVTMIDGVAHWKDITPKRFAETEGSDFDAEWVRKRRGR